VREDGRDRIEVEAFDRIELQALRGEAERQAFGADRLGAFRQDRAEAVGRAREDAERRIELIGEPGGGCGIRQRHELAREGKAELRELARAAAEVAECDWPPASAAVLSTTGPQARRDRQRCARELVDAHRDVGAVSLRRQPEERGTARPSAGVSTSSLWWRVNDPVRR
jgi:hypothetical protein